VEDKLDNIGPPHFEKDVHAELEVIIDRNNPHAAGSNDGLVP